MTMTNDNRRPAAATRIALYGLPDQANACPCGNAEPFVDGYNLNGSRRTLFVWCPACGASGPERPSYNDALAAWNRATLLRDMSCIRVVDT